MKREDLIKLCKYYKGEKTCPEGTNPQFWEYENAWVDASLNDHKLLENALDIYISFGLTVYNLRDGVPVSLKALLFSRFLHWQGGYGRESDCANFKEFYSDYLKG